MDIVEHPTWVKLVFSSGREEDVAYAVVGLDLQDLSVRAGYDTSLPSITDKSFSRRELEELADFMIRKWAEVKEKGPLE